MATRDEVQGILEMLASAFNQPIGDTDNDVWPDVLSSYQAGHVLEVAEMYCTGGAGTYFPKLPEFVMSVNELVRRDNLHSIQENRTEAAYRCDGSRWRDHATAKNRDGSPGLEPCPSCNPVLFAELSNADKNRQWHHGMTMDRDALVVAPKEPCMPLKTETVAPRVGMSRMHEANANDWAKTRKDLA
jgi:hypothetical protein